jgi:hypothetical protein
MEVKFDSSALQDGKITNLVKDFFKQVTTLESIHQIPVFIFQDGVTGSYYIKCSISATEAGNYCDLNAKLDASDTESFRSNRELLLTHNTYIKMEEDASAGREFNDIIVEYDVTYDAGKPLKVWGGQHRISAIRRKGAKSNRYHGFRIYFNLSKQQRNELALISNTSMNVSNDTFDRMIEETTFGNKLREWCWKVGLLEEDEDFPDTGSRSERITVKRARSFVVNFYLGKERGQELTTDELDNNIYSPYLVETGVSIDPKYVEIMKRENIVQDSGLLKAGQSFVTLHKVQMRTVTSEKSNINNRKAYRNKAFIESVLCGWSYVAGLLQSHPERLENHYDVPKTTIKIPDPLNAQEMSEFKHDSDLPTYRGLGTRSSSKDRQRLAQLFLAKSREKNVVLDKNFMHKAVSTVVSIQYRADGYV